MVGINDDYTFKGYRLVILENSFLKVVVLPEKGADIYQFIDKEQQLDFLWKTPFGLRRNVRSVPAGYGGESNFSNSYEGGWQLVFPNGGNSCYYKGVSQEMCGDAQAAVYSYRLVKKDSEEVRVELETVLHRMPYSICRTLVMRADSPILVLKETIKNEGREPMDFIWGQHVGFDGSYLRDGSWRVAVPCSRVYTNTGPLKSDTMKTAGARVNRMVADGESEWPFAPGTEGELLDISRIPDTRIRSCDIAYLHELRQGEYCLYSDNRDVGFHLEWDHKLLPYIWFYQNFNGSFDYPWYGRGNGIVLEPVSSFPALGIEEAILRKNSRAILPGEEISTKYTASVLKGKQLKQIINSKVERN